MPIYLSNMSQFKSHITKISVFKKKILKFFEFPPSNSKGGIFIMKSKKILLSIRAFKNLDRFLLIVRKMQN